MLKEADGNENNGGHDNREMGMQLLLNKPLVEGGYYNDQDMHEQAEHLHSEYREDVTSIHQQQEKLEQELHKYYKKETSSGRDY